MIPLTLKDCESAVVNYYGQPEAIIEAIGELEKQFSDGKIDIVSLHQYTRRDIIDTPVTYDIVSYTKTYNHTVIDKCSFLASHYIGRFSYKDVNIVINPRWGDELFCYLIGYTSNLYLPLGDSSISKNSGTNSFWLIALIWKAMLNKALEKSQTPKEYQRITRNQKNFRGHLNIYRQIHYNICNSALFYCDYKKLSVDNTINRTIRCVYKYLKIKGLTHLINEFEEYDKKLSSLGVSDNIHPEEIDNIRYSRMTESYQPVMELSQTILRNIKAESDLNGIVPGCSYFIDIADLWEMYLLKVLQRNLPEGYIAFSPNTSHGDYLIENNMREIRPDIIVMKDNRVVAIIDAKYKNYHFLGRTANYGIQREDLYQMCTYLYHYGKPGTPIVGIFSSPTENHNTDLHIFTHEKNHRIGVVNLNIENCRLCDIKSEEIRYAKRIINAVEVASDI